VYAYKFAYFHVFEVFLEFEVVRFERDRNHHPDKFYVLVIRQHSLGLVQPVAMIGGLVLAIFIVACVFEHVVEMETFSSLIAGMSLIVKAQYVDPAEFFISGHFESSWSRAPSQAGLEPFDVCLGSLVLGVLVIVIAPNFVCLGIVRLCYLQYHLGVHCHEEVWLLCPVHCVAGEHRAVFL